MVANEDIQKKLQREIDETMQDCNGKLTYESIFKMKYLDMVVSGEIITVSLCKTQYRIFSYVYFISLSFWFMITFLSFNALYVYICICIYVYSLY